MENRNPDTLPDSRDQSGPCPNCGRISNFTLLGGPGGGSRDHSVGDHHVASFLRCHGCMKSTLVVERRTSTLVYDSDGELKTDEQSRPLRETGRVPVMWWPTPGAGTMDPAVPAEVAEAFDEGARCHSVKAYRAAATMFRLMLGFVVKELATAKGFTFKGNPMLGPKIGQLAAAGHLDGELGDWAEHITLLGNAGAHDDDDKLVTPDPNEVQELQDLCRHLIKTRYEVPASIQRARQRRPEQVAKKPS